MSSSRKVTIKQITDFIRNKSCNRPFAQYFAEELLKDPDHPIVTKADFRMTDIFDHIEVTSDKELIPRNKTL